jgi:hypothetical protein
MGQGNGQNNHDELHWNTAMEQRDWAKVHAFFFGVGS